MRGLPHYPVPDLKTCLEANLQAARLTSPDVIAVGVAVYTSNLDGADAAARVCAEIEDALGLPCQDPVTMGMARSEEHTSELQSLMRISYAVFCLKKKNNTIKTNNHSDTEQKTDIVHS